MSEEFELISVPKELLENLVNRILTEYISLSAPRKPFVRLSEEEVSEMAQKCFIRREAGQYHIPYGTTDFARAIEDALEEKNRDR